MRIVMIISMLLLCGLPFKAAQAEVFFNRNKAAQQDSAPAAESAPEGAPAEKAAPKKSVVRPIVTAKNKEAIKDFANRYYQNCSKQQHPVLMGEDLRMLCACSSAKVSETMTVEEIQLMNTATPEGQAKRNKMLTHVYAPCMQYPTRALITKTCMSDPAVQATLPDPEPICDCLGEEMGNYVGQNAQEVIRKSLAENPGTLDPLSSFLASEDYDKTSKALLNTCIQRTLIGQKNR